MNSSARNNTKSTDLDDWETDPDFVRDMDEMDQRWGSKRTLGSVNMQNIIEDVHKSHRLMRQEAQHPSQKSRDDFRDIIKQRSRTESPGYECHEETTKKSSQEYSRKIITSSVKSGSVTEAKRILQEKCDDSYYKSRPKPVRVPSASSDHRQPSTGGVFKSTTSPTEAGHLSEEDSYSKRYTREENSSSSSKLPADVAFKSIQKKIDAFKKEFEEMESKISGAKSRLETSSSSTNNLDSKRTNEAYSSSTFHDLNSSADPSQRPKPTATSGHSSMSGANRPDVPKSSIKSLSERFETMCRDDQENMKRDSEAKRKEFFSEIKNQVLETRKGLEGFDPIDTDYYNEVDKRIREKLSKQSSSTTNNRSTTDNSTATSGTSSRVSPSLAATRPASGGSSSPLGRPKFYTRREVTQEKVISRIVKENDKIVQNETKRNVERSSSCHGSSDEDDGPTASSIKLLNEKYRGSPLQGISPVDPLKRVPTPQREVDLKGAGLMARTLFDYQAAEDDELTFDVDDLITDIQKVDVNWYKGTITRDDGTKVVGLFPANYVKLLNDTGEH